MGLHLVAVPLERQRQRYGAVVVAVGMDALRRVQDQSRQAAFLFAAVAIVLLVIGLERLTRRFVHEPLGAVLGTMAHAAAGDLGARAPRIRRDEIGAVAEGLNGLLERMGRFNETLRSEVARATDELRSSNEALRATAQRLFDARRELAQSQRLALAGQMAASVAHQVGTPLNVISGYVQLLKAKQDADSPDAARLSTIQEQIARVTAIVQSLLDRTRRPALSLRPLAPAELVSGLAELVRPLARRPPDRARARGRPGPAPGRRGPRAARAGALEPRQQRGRRDALGGSAEARGTAPRVGRRHRGGGYGGRHPGRGPATRVRPALYDQAAGQGHRPRPRDPARGGRGARRLGAGSRAARAQGTTALVCLPLAAGETASTAEGRA
jgi:signal transduction histidine kinase